MKCELSASMTPRKCEVLQRSNRECIGCECRAKNSAVTRTVILELPFAVYEFFRVGAVGQKATVEELIEELAAMAAMGKIRIPAAVKRRMVGEG